MSAIENRLVSEFEDKDYAHAYMDSHLIDRISTQIYQLRLQRGWTQEQLASRAEIAQERISLLESGDFTSITIKTLRKLAEAFDVSLTIKFESFADAIVDFVSLSVEKLQVKPRMESISELKQTLLISEQMPNISLPTLDTCARVGYHRTFIDNNDIMVWVLGATENPELRAMYGNKAQNHKSQLEELLVAQTQNWYGGAVARKGVSSKSPALVDLRGISASTYWHEDDAQRPLK